MQEGEKRLSLKELVAALRLKYGIKRHKLTVYQWCRKGIVAKPTASSRPVRIKLESRIVGGTIQTTLEAYERFEAKLSAAREAEK